MKVRTDGPKRKGTSKNRSERKGGGKATGHPYRLRVSQAAKQVYLALLTAFRYIATIPATGQTFAIAANQKIRLRTTAIDFGLLDWMQAPILVKPRTDWRPSQRLKVKVTGSNPFISCASTLQK